MEQCFCKVGFNVVVHEWMVSTVIFPTNSMAEQSGANCISILNIILRITNYSLCSQQEITPRNIAVAQCINNETLSFSIPIEMKLKATTMVSFSILAKQMLQFMSPCSLKSGYYHAHGSSMAGVLCNTMT